MNDIRDRAVLNLGESVDIPFFSPEGGQSGIIGNYVSLRHKGLYMLGLISGRNVLTTEAMTGTCRRKMKPTDGRKDGRVRIRRVSR